MHNYSTNTCQSLIKKRDQWIFLYYLIFGLSIFLFIAWVVICITCTKFLPQYIPFFGIAVFLFYIRNRINKFEMKISKMENS